MPELEIKICPLHEWEEVHWLLSFSGISWLKFRLNAQLDEPLELRTKDINIFDNFGNKMYSSAHVSCTEIEYWSYQSSPIHAQPWALSYDDPNYNYHKRIHVLQCNKVLQAYSSSSHIDNPQYWIIFPHPQWRQLTILTCIAHEIEGKNCIEVILWFHLQRE